MDLEKNKTRYLQVMSKLIIDHEMSSIPSASYTK